MLFTIVNCFGLSNTFALFIIILNYLKMIFIGCNVERTMLFLPLLMDLGHGSIRMH